MEKYYTTQQLMEIFRVSRWAIHRANQSGVLTPAKKDGTQNLYSEADVLNYIEESSKGKIDPK